MKAAMLKLLAVLSVLVLASTLFAQPDPPQRPDPVPPFQIPRLGSTLDDGWQYMQTLADADSGYPQLLNALPVQAVFTHQGRGFLALLHTVFFSDNGGRTWRNLDPDPPPSFSEFIALRSPAYVSGIAARPVAQLSETADSLFVSTYDAASNRGRVRLLRHVVNNYYLLPDTLRFFTGPHWLTGVVSPDSDNVYTVAGYDRKIYFRDSLTYPSITRWDSLYATQSDQWVTSIVERADSLIMAVGGEHWISRDGGHTWGTAPAADSQGDNSVSFSDSLHGLVGGGRLNPNSGWVHRTTDAGYSWSERLLETSYPIRCVEMVTPEIGFAAGGDYHVGAGEIWKTTDGGQTWNLDATMSAEITALTSARVSGAYVNVIAAGVFPDFHGGVWRNQLYLPDESSAALVINPDSVDFGVVARGDTGQAQVVIHNAGTIAAYITGVESSNPAFAATNLPAGTQIAPGADFTANVIFAPPVLDTLQGDYSGSLMVQSADGVTELVVHGAVPLSADEPPVTLPRSVSLSVWPNPGNAVFQIRFELAQASETVVRVYDVTGRLAGTLVQRVQQPGTHVVSWNASGAASGIYFVRLDADNTHLTHKLLLIK